MMEGWRLFILNILVIWSFLIVSSAQKLHEKTPRAKRTMCPNTCTLKRRVSKIERRIQRDLIESKTEIKNEIEALRLLINDTSHPDGARDNMEPGTEIVAHADENVVHENDSPDRENDEQSDVDNLRRTIQIMESNIQALQQQNAELLLLSQEMRAQTAVLRARDEISNEDIAWLRKHSQNKIVSSSDQDRIGSIEGKVSDHAAQINAAESSIEWLMARVDQLSNAVDTARSEASSANNEAARATDAATRALKIARRRAPTVSAQRNTPTTDDDGLRQPRVPPEDCGELYNMGYNVSGVYRIKPRSYPTAFEVYCEQSYSGGGWTVIQRRRDGSLDFDRNWNAYADGFGEPNGELWLGNEKLYHFTNQADYRLQVLLLDWEGNRAFAEYDTFNVQGNPDNYALQFGTYVAGNAGDGLRGASRSRSRNAYLAEFTTNDIDNDDCQSCVANSEGDTFYNCARLQGGGWWFRACSDSNLNGRYILPQNFSSCDEVCYGIQWRTWKKNPMYSLKATIMILRSNQHTNET